MFILTARCVWLHACLTRQPTNQDNNGVGRILNVFLQRAKNSKVCVSWQSTPRKQIDWHVSINQACTVLFNLMDLAKPLQKSDYYVHTLK